MNTPEIRVSLTEDGHPGDCNCGMHYSAIVMDWSEDNKTWYNTGIVIWADNPTDAFSGALIQYLENGD